MRIETRLTRRLGIDLPIIQAPMAGGGDTARLVAAVSNAGGMGSIGAAYLTPEQILDRVRTVREQTSKPFGINLFAPQQKPEVTDQLLEAAVQRIAPFYAELGLPAPGRPSAPATLFEDQVSACVESGAAVFSFTFGIVPKDAIEAARSRGMLVVGTATTVKEAQALVDAGVDAMVVQGSEAGGHRGSFAQSFEQGMIGTMALVPQIVDAVDVPVIASGGIMDARGITAALALGASAVQMGTAFLTCEEAGVSRAYREAILSANEDQTSLTRAFSGRPARGVVNKMLADYARDPDGILPFPLQNVLTRPLRTKASELNRAEFLSLWAGQGVRMARRESAAELMRRLEIELTQNLQRMNSLMQAG